MVAKDKTLHFCINFLTVFIGTHLIGLAGALFVAIAISLGKEFYDKYIQKTKFDWEDVRADTFGIVSAVSVLAIIELIFGK